MKKNLKPLYTVVIPPQAAIVVSETYLASLGIDPELCEFDPVFRHQFVGLEIPPAPETKIHVWEPEQKCLSRSISDELGQASSVGFSQFCVFLSSRAIKTFDEFVTFLRGKDGQPRPVRASGHMGDGRSYWVIWPVSQYESIGVDSVDRVVSSSPQ